MSALVKVAPTQEECQTLAVEFLDELDAVTTSANLYHLTACIELPAHVVDFQPGLIPGEPA